METSAQPKSVSSFNPAGFSLISVLVIIAILFLMAIFFLDPVNFVSKIGVKKPIVSTITEGELLIPLVLLKNPMIYAWGGTFKGLVSAKDSDSIIVTNSGYSLTMSLEKTDSTGRALNKVINDGTSTGKAVDILPADISIGDVVIGEFSLKDKDKSIIKVQTMTVGTGVFSPPSIITNSVGLIPGGTKIAEKDLPFSVQILKNPAVSTWRARVTGNLVAKDENSITLGKENHRIIVQVNPSSEQVYGTKFYKWNGQEVPLDEIRLGVELVGSFWVYPDKNVGVTFAIKESLQ
ncbi:hypothetical protein HYU92_06745 [Candidatus Curtissbacteria bacterium]|nr:hypothetical protein [Candidatus Curtissbacteria bacterium]